MEMSACRPVDLPPFNKYHSLLLELFKKEEVKQLLNTLYLFSPVLFYPKKLIGNEGLLKELLELQVITDKVLDVKIDAVRLTTLGLGVLEVYSDIVLGAKEISNGLKTLRKIYDEYRGIPCKLKKIIEEHVEVMACSIVDKFLEDFPYMSKYLNILLSDILNIAVQQEYIDKETIYQKLLLRFRW